MEIVVTLHFLFRYFPATSGFGQQYFDVGAEDFCLELPQEKQIQEAIEVNKVTLLSPEWRYNIAYSQVKVQT